MWSQSKAIRALLLVAIIGGAVVSIRDTSLRNRQQLFNNFLVGVA